jgi:hypothetical protein
MGKTFRKDSSYNKYNRRDSDAKQKFSKKFKNPKRNDTKPTFVPSTPDVADQVYPDDMNREY